MAAPSDDFRQKLFRAAGMPCTKPQYEHVVSQSFGTAANDGSGRRNSTLEMPNDGSGRRNSTLEMPNDGSGRRNSTSEMPPGSPTRRQSVVGHMDGLSRHISSGQSQSPALNTTNAGSRRSTVLADLDAAAPFSLGSTNFFSRQKAVKEALVQSILRRTERNRDSGNSLFLFPGNRNQVSTASSSGGTIHSESNTASDTLGDSIADFVKLGVQVSSSWLKDELKISPTAKKRFEIFRNPTPEFLDDPTTPQLGSLKLANDTLESCESIEHLLASRESADVKMFDIQLSASDFLKKQGIHVDGSQTMLQKIIWNHDECLMNLQHLSLSARDVTALSAWLLNLPPTTRLFLKFRNCGLTDRSFELLFGALIQTASLIYAFDLSDNKLTSRSSSQLLILLETCKKCQQWELCGLHLQDSFAEALSKSNVQDAVYFLSKLDLSNNTFGNFGMCNLVPMLSTFPLLEYLDLSFARITSKAASRISTCFSDFQRLSHLALNNCCLSDEDANIIVCSSMKCKTLTKLSLKDNQIVLMPILSLCSHLCANLESHRTLLTVIDFSSNPLDFIAYERLMDMKEERMFKGESDSMSIFYNDCNWSHNLFSTLSKEANSIAYGHGRNFNVNCKTVRITCDSTKFVWQCFLMVLQWRQSHSLPICRSDFTFSSKSGLFEVFSIPKEAAIQISCHELGFWDVIGHETADIQVSVTVENWILGILKLISLHDFGVPEDVILPVIKNLIFRHDMFTETKNWKQLVSFSGSHDGRLSILLVALAKQISSPGFKDNVMSLPKSIMTLVSEKFSNLLLQSGNFYSGRWYICFEQYLHKLSFELLHSLNRSVRIQRINELSLDLSDDCSVNIVRAVRDETGNCVDFDKFVDSKGCILSTKSFVTFDLSLPTCAQGNVSDDLETATLILQCKNWAQSVCSLGIDAINAKSFASNANAIEFHDVSGALELVMLARCRNYRCEQLVPMIQAFDHGLIHRVPEDEPKNCSTELWYRHPLLKALFRIECGGFRASFLHLMWDSIIDKQFVAATIAPCLKSWEWHGAIKRLGSLSLFNPLCAQGLWKLQLDKRDDRMVADMIIQLKIKEKGHMTSGSPRKDSSSHQAGDNVDGKPFDIRSIDSSELLPASGDLVIHLKSIETADFDLELRHKLAQKCAVKEWVNTDIWFREMLAKRK